MNQVATPSVPLEKPIGKLGSDPFLTRQEAEAGDTGEVTDRTCTRVQLALEDAAEDDPDFAELLQAAVDQAPRARKGHPAQGMNIQTFPTTVTLAAILNDIRVALAHAREATGASSRS